MAAELAPSTRRAAELGVDLRFYGEVERLMPLAYELALREPRTAHGRVLLAERVRGARGRHGRIWVAERGGLWLALSLYDDHLPQTRGLFSLLFGVALGALAREMGLPAHVRWINDLHHRGRKIAGVLIEKRGDWLVVGIGVNVNNPPPHHLPAESLARLAGAPLSLEDLTDALLGKLRYYYGLLRELESSLAPGEDLPENPLVRDFLELSDTPGRCVAWARDLDRDPPLLGRAEGVLPDGSLLLRTGGDLLTLETGEIIYLY
ncbi:biotin--[acetyl-CoA-carboxylase] ligase [Thermosulfurimonas sp. F29]|uniref:biotin--[acetyl-CoA-carboxylase] ligase n=1 Tax=Thermosulfurimonas sp. F29 TaxID=2867247 RepID=UPI001C83A17F|nr:biotin--[acetyl-CoA-carboxylase] ligase [Thermosulfurimonas sp. F29]MBX6422200.1 biotin--[acetyl-CoA-carboxylase] ligase [Thermosulfurimonas sp. F29]